MSNTLEREKNIAERTIKFALLHRKEVDFYQPSDSLIETTTNRIVELGLKHQWQFPYCELEYRESHGINLGLYAHTTLRVWK